MNNKKIYPYNIKKLGIDFNGKPVVQQSFKGNFTKEQIINYVQAKSNTYKNKGINAQIQLVTRWNPGKRGWRAGAFTNAGEPIDWYEDKEWYEDGEETPEHFSDFRLYFQKM